jgi:putative ABC transport system permease protein
MLAELLSDLRYRLRALFFPADVDRELDDELRDHLERAAAANRAAGMRPDEAVRQARLALGGLEDVRESTRDAHGVRWLEVAWQDLRTAARTLGGQRGFAAIAVGSLAIGISVSAAVLTLRQSVYSGGLAFRHTQDVVALYEPEADAVFSTRQYNIARYRLRPAVLRSTLLRDFALFTVTFSRFRTDSSDTRVATVLATPSLATILGVRPELGRAFVPADGAPGSGDVALLSHGFWVSHFGGDSAVLGRSMVLDGRVATIVGVLPRDVTFPPYAAIWLARSQYALLADSAAFLQAFARLTPGASLPRANAELAVVARSDSAFSHLHGPLGVLRATPFADYLTSQFAGALGLLTGLAIALGLIAAVNFAALVLARGLRRREELGIRAALGASTGRLVAHMLAECVLLGIGGGTLGALAAPALIKGLDTLIPGFVPPWLHVQWGLWAALGAVALAVGLGVVFGLAPAIELARPAAAGFLRAGTGGAVGMERQRASRRLLVAFQVFLAIGPIVTLSLLMGPEMRLHRPDPGFDVRELYVGNMYGAQSDSLISSTARRSQLLDAMRSVPAVRAAALSVDWYLPIAAVQADTGGNTGFVQTQARGGTWHLVTPEYFDARKLDLIAGRYPTKQEIAEGAPVAVASAHSAVALAAHVRTGWRVRLSPSALHATTLTVVGIVRDVMPYGYGRPPNLEFYSPLVGMAFDRAGASAWIRAAGPPSRVVTTVYEALHRQDAAAELIDLQSQVHSSEAVLHEMHELVLMIAISFAIAIGLAGLGIYGIIAYSAVTRRKEMAIRLALGAARRHLALLITREAAMQTLIGAALGIFGGVTAVVYLADSTDPLKAPPLGVVGMACGALLLVLLAASIGPVRRVWRADAATALREDG